MRLETLRVIKCKRKIWHAESCGLFTFEDEHEFSFEWSTYNWLYLAIALRSCLLSPQDQELNTAHMPYVYVQLYNIFHFARLAYAMIHSLRHFTIRTTPDWADQKLPIHLRKLITRAEIRSLPWVAPCHIEPSRRNTITLQNRIAPRQKTHLKKLLKPRYQLMLWMNECEWGVRVELICDGLCYSARTMSVHSAHILNTLLLLFVSVLVSFVRSSYSTPFHITHALTHH